MFRSLDHLRGATRFLAKVTFLNNTRCACLLCRDTQSQAHTQWRTAYTIRHAATTLN